MEESNVVNKRKIGKENELLVAKYLIKEGLKLITQNYQVWGGELDLVMYDPKVNQVVFVEVKSRERYSYVSPYEIISKKKKSLIIRTARLWILKNLGPKEVDWRIDVVITSQKEGIIWLKNEIYL